MLFFKVLLIKNMIIIFKDYSKQIYMEDYKNEQERINEDMLFDVFIIMNGIIIGGIAINNRLIILDTLNSLLYSFIDKLIYIKSYFDVKYDQYIKPVMGYVNNLIKIKDIYNKQEEVNKPIQINIIFKDDTTVIINSDNLENIDISSYTENDIENIFVYKIDENKELNCIIYDNLDDLKELINGYVVFPERSNIEFIGIRITLWNKIFDISPEIISKYCIVGNNIFTDTFIRYILEHYHGHEIRRNSSYTIHLIDNDVNELIFENNKFLILEKNNYRLIKIQGTYNSPSEESD
jgi:hypothetical protein